MKKVILIIILLITLTNNKFLIKADEDISNDTVTEDEVAMNGGGYQDTTITQGYTRCIYINET